MNPKKSGIAPIRPSFGEMPQIVMLPIALDALIEQVADRVVEKLETVQRSQCVGPEVIGPVEMARRLDISRTTLHRLRVEGCPAVRLGDVYKFEPSAVLAWLKSRGQP